MGSPFAKKLFPNRVVLGTLLFLLLPTSSVQAKPKIEVRVPPQILQSSKKNGYIQVYLDAYQQHWKSLETLPPPPSSSKDSANAETPSEEENLFSKLCLAQTDQDFRRACAEGYQQAQKDYLKTLREKESNNTAFSDSEKKCILDYNRGLDTGALLGEKEGCGTDLQAGDLKPGPHPACFDAGLSDGYKTYRDKQRQQQANLSFFPDNVIKRLLPLESPGTTGQPVNHQKGE